MFVALIRARRVTAIFVMLFLAAGFHGARAADCLERAADDTTNDNCAIGVNCATTDCGELSRGAPTEARRHGPIAKWLQRGLEEVFGKLTHVMAVPDAVYARVVLELAGVESSKRVKLIDETPDNIVTAFNSVDRAFSEARAELEIDPEMYGIQLISVVLSIELGTIDVSSRQDPAKHVSARIDDDHRIEFTQGAVKRADIGNQLQAYLRSELFLAPMLVLPESEPEELLRTPMGGIHGDDPVAAFLVAIMQRPSPPGLSVEESISHAIGHARATLWITYLASRHSSDAPPGIDLVKVHTARRVLAYADGQWQLSE